jgi:DNA-directed RNA polymerase sigma subunit (sigma70/sigma32)
MEESLGARLLKQMKEIGELAGIKTEEYARVSRRRIDALSLDREISKEKGALGERVFELAERGEPTDVRADVAVQALIERIRRLLVELAECEKVIGSIREGAATRTADVKRRYRDEDDAGRPGVPRAGDATIPEDPDRTGAPPGKGA